jgi:hypothetical protein
MHRLLHSALALLAWPALGLAGDGVIEINQAAALAGGITPTDTAGFPVTIDQPGSYRLTGDLTLSASDVAAIDIDANDVTVDLGGFTIAGTADCVGLPPFLTCLIPANGDGITATSSSSNVTVHNGKLRNLRLGIVLSGDAGRVESVDVRRGSASGIAATGFGAVIRDVISTLNRGTGISAGVDARVADSTVISNNDDGINVGFNSNVSGNTVTANGEVGISAAQGSRVAENTASDNAGFGLDLSAGAGYGGNVLDGNNGGNPMPQLSGGISLGPNVCASALCP